MKRSQKAVVVLAACAQLFSPTLARGDNDPPADTEKVTANDGNTSALVKKESNPDPEPAVMTPAQLEAYIQSVVNAELSKAKAQVPTETKEKIEKETQGDPSTETTSLPAPRVKELSASQFDAAVHNQSITYNSTTGEVVFSGTTSQECMNKFSFVRGEGSTEVIVKFTYRAKEELDCLDEKKVICDEDHPCVGLRNKADSRVKLGTEGGSVKIAYRDPYNQEERLADVLKSKDGDVTHKGVKEIAQEKAEAAEKARREKLAKLRKQFKQDLRTCNDEEAQLAIRRDYLADLVAIGEKTEEEAEKIQEKLDAREKKINEKKMKLLAKELVKADFTGSEDETSDVEAIREKMAALKATGDENLIKIYNEAHLANARRIAQDPKLHPLVAAQMAQDELAELADAEGLSEKESELIALEQMKLGMRIGCLSGTVNLALPQNAVACQNIQMAIQQERLAATRAVQPIFGADGKLNPAFMNSAQTTAANGTDRNLANLTGQTSLLGQQAAPSLSFADFAQLRSPDGGLPFIPNATQPNANGSINATGYQPIQYADPRANLIR